MAQVIWTEPALEQLDEIAGYIALDKPSAASGLVERVFAAVDRLEQFPHSRRRPPELPDSIYREVVCSPCRVLYRNEEHRNEEHRNEESRVLIIHVMRDEMQLRKYLLE
ncbi:type II toxin-antitoxin system RelE/ParE family toxin [Microbulbifer rhizosphaerae]|uniref:Plasmid stabilization system protein ParE n=1 Tax=Microbulbifer rhizosphaerae TaxID=1562603 RepID=A0A7W4WFE8_9GAMM|nr:type II toxin-antitoxin system RelE/ParE family toxin [Microbulbifer rhizosphaerae]MBB3063230.1 plasmid stabilization system protein ParE [Microbulbifer rhizosphaerae]